MPDFPKTITLDRFSGLNNTLSPEHTDPQYLKTADNIDIDKSGGLHKRKGYIKRDTGDYHSLWTDDTHSICYCVKDGDLIRLYPDYSNTVIQSSVGSATIKFERVDGITYSVSKDRAFVIDENETYRPFGIDHPNGGPVLSAISGTLTAGDYQVALTYVASDGRESGTGVAQLIALTSNQNIRLTNIPTSSDSTVDRVRIYCSTPNGEILYLQGEITNGTSTYTIGDTYSYVTPLKSFNVYPAPTGHIIRYAHGRLWIAQDNILWYSEPFAYEWFKLQSNFLPFNTRIKAVMPTEGGMWVGADNLFYLNGRNPDQMRKDEKEPVQVVEGSDVKIPGAYIFIENTPLGYKWLFTTNKGVFIGFNDGVVLNVTERNVVFPKADEGTGIFLQTDGINRYLSILKEKQSSGNMAASDLVTTTVIRNGVELT